MRTWSEARYVLRPRGWDADDDYYSWYERLYELLVHTIVAVLPPFVEHEDGWRARQVALLAVIDWPPPPPPTDQGDLIVVWRASIARAYGVPLIPPDVAVREFGAEE